MPGAPLWGALFVPGFLSSSDVKASSISAAEQEPDEDSDFEERWDDDGHEGDVMGTGGRSAEEEERQQEEHEHEQEEERHEREAEERTRRDEEHGWRESDEEHLQAEERASAEVAARMLGLSGGDAAED